MKKILKNSWLCIILLLSINACSKDKLVIDENLGGMQYDLPKGAPGSIDERIYNIYQKFGTYILYDFAPEDLAYLWSGGWSVWYTPAITTDEKYVSKVLDVLESTILNKFEPEFIRRSFPYKVFIVDSLGISYTKPTASKEFSNARSNGQNAFAIANAGAKSDNFKEADWKKMSVDLNATFTQYYFAALPVKPVAFTASKRQKLTGTMADDPTGEDPRYEYSMWTDGLILGRLGTTYLTPYDDQDYADFVAFLTGTPGKEIMRRLNKYQKLKERTMLLVPFLDNVVEMNVVGSQNLNCPDDKLPAGYFDTLQ